MKSPKSVFVSTVAVGAVAVLFAAEFAQTSRPAHAAEPVAAFKATVTPAKARPGQTVVVKIIANVQSPYHIYSSAPIPPPGPVPTSFTFKATGLTPIGKVMESMPKRKMDSNFGKMVGIHEKTATFTQKFTVARSAKPGKLPIAIEAAFMACDATRCLPPRFVDVAPISVTVEKAK